MESLLVNLSVFSGIAVGGLNVSMLNIMPVDVYSADLEDLRRRKKDSRKKAYRKSCLEKYRAQLVGYRKVGASYSDLVFWLRADCKLEVSRSTVFRYLKQLPEIRKWETE
jgi:hypothetical protein